jgi:hypothetical protein
MESYQAKAFARDRTFKQLSRCIKCATAAVGVCSGYLGYRVAFLPQCFNVLPSRFMSYSG